MAELCHYCNKDLSQGSRPTTPAPYTCPNCKIEVKKVCTDCAWWLLGPRYNNVKVVQEMNDPSDQVPQNAVATPCPMEKRPVGAAAPTATGLLDLLKSECGTIKRQCQKERLADVINPAWKVWDDLYKTKYSDSVRRMIHTLIAVYISAETRCRNATNGYIHLYDAPKIARKHLEACFVGKGNPLFIPDALKYKAAAALHSIELVNRLFRSNISIGHAYRFFAQFAINEANMAYADLKYILVLATQVYQACYVSMQAQAEKPKFKPVGALGYLTKTEQDAVFKANKYYTTAAFGKLNKLFTVIDTAVPDDLPKLPYYTTSDEQEEDFNALEGLDLNENQIHFFQSLPKMDHMVDQLHQTTECERAVRLRVGVRLYNLFAEAFENQANRALAPKTYRALKKASNAYEPVAAQVQQNLAAYNAFLTGPFPVTENNGLMFVEKDTLFGRIQPRVDLLNTFFGNPQNIRHLKVFLDSMDEADVPLKKAFNEASRIRTTAALFRQVDLSKEDLVHHINENYQNDALRRFLVSPTDNSNGLKTLLETEELRLKNAEPSKPEQAIVDLLIQSMAGPTAWLETSFCEGLFNALVGKLKAGKHNELSLANDYSLNHNEVKWAKVFRRCKKNTAGGYWGALMPAEYIKNHGDSRMSASEWYWDWRVEKDRSIYDGIIENVGPYLAYKTQKTPETNAPILTSLTPYPRCPVANPNYGFHMYVWKNELKQRSIYTLSDRMPSRRSILMLIQDMLFDTDSKMGTKVDEGARQSMTSLYCAQLEANIEFDDAQDARLPEAFNQSNALSLHWKDQIPNCTTSRGGQSKTKVLLTRMSGSPNIECHVYGGIKPENDAVGLLVAHTARHDQWKKGKSIEVNLNKKKDVDKLLALIKKTPSGKLPYHVFTWDQSDKSATQSPPGYLPNAWTSKQYAAPVKDDLTTQRRNFTTFTYANVTQSAVSGNLATAVTISVDVTNTSDVQRKEKVYLWVKKIPDGRITKTEVSHEVTCISGETKTATKSLNWGAIKFLPADGAAKSADAGDYKIQVRSSAEEIVGEKDYTIT